MTEAATLIIVEDDTALREALCDTAEIAGYRALPAPDGPTCLRLLGTQAVDLVITDLQMDPMDGLTLLREIRRRHHDLPVLLMTAYGTIQSAIDAMKSGASDYLVKPFEAEVLVSNLQRWIAAPAVADDDAVIEDGASKRVAELARRVAQSDASVMITGESGVGKEVFFRMIHRHSRRAKLEPVAINCAAIPENMLEAVLFGHEKGAFTGAYKSIPGKFEQAQGSTLLLDEISEMSLALQAKLLRVLQERQVERLGSQDIIALDVRVIATSNRDLKQEVAAGRFREDLYYRLNVFPLHVPALRERRADILPLADFLLARAAHRTNVPVPTLTPSAGEALLAHPWPGNIRELDNVMQRALVVCSGPVIEAADLMFETLNVAPQRQEAPSVVLPAADRDADESEDEDESLGNDLKDHERRLILNALAEGKGSRKYAAEKLGISPRTLRYKIARMKEEGMAVPER
jgi:two-component system response regulator FlrC